MSTFIGPQYDTTGSVNGFRNVSTDMRGTEVLVVPIIDGSSIFRRFFDANGIISSTRPVISLIEMHPYVLRRLNHELERSR